MTIRFVIRGCVITFAAVAAAFHVLRPDIDPLARGVSRYQWGTHGWAMSVAFALLAIALAGTARLTRAAVAPGSTVVPRLWNIAAIGSLMVAAVPLSDAPRILPAIAHQLGGALLFSASAIAMCMAPPALVGRALSVLGRLAMAVLVTFLATVVLAPSWVGLVQRIVLATLCVWLVAAPARSRSRHPNALRTPSFVSRAARW